MEKKWLPTLLLKFVPVSKENLVYTGKARSENLDL